MGFRLTPISMTLDDRHVELEQFWQAFASRGFVSDSWAFLFTHLLYVPIYTRLQIVMLLSQTLTKLCHIKRDYPVHVICYAQMSTTGRNARFQTFAKVVDSFVDRYL